MGSRHSLATQWLGHVEQWRTSGLSQAGYCAREGLSVSAFGYWVAKANRGARTQGPQSLTLVAARAQWLDLPGRAEASTLTVRSPGGWQLSFAQCPPAAWLRELLDGAGR